jgi:hypothetical protein
MPECFACGCDRERVDVAFQCRPQTSAKHHKGGMAGAKKQQQPELPPSGSTGPGWEGVGENATMRSRSTCARAGQTTSATTGRKAHSGHEMGGALYTRAHTSVGECSKPCTCGRATG